MRLKGRDGMRWEKINIFCTSGTWVGSLLSLLLPCLEKKNPKTPCSNSLDLFFSLLRPCLEKSSPETPGRTG